MFTEADAYALTWFMLIFSIGVVVVSSMVLFQKYAKPSVIKVGYRRTRTASGTVVLKPTTNKALMMRLGKG